MKRILLPALFSAMYLCSSAQNPALRARLPKVNYLENTSVSQLAERPVVAAPKKKAVNGAKRNVNAIQLGSAGNALTVLRSENNCISANQDLNTIVFIHRNDPNAFPDYTVAQYRYDISTDGGQTFTLNHGPLNPLADNLPGGINSRFPQAWINNPAGNTNPANAWLSYIGAWHDNIDETSSTIWNGITYGMMKLNGDTATATEHSETTNNGDVLIAASMAKGLPGEYWAVDNEYSGYSNDSMIIVYKGVVNGAGDDITWSVFTKLNPEYYKLQTPGEADSTFYSVPVISFDPSGMHGWICIGADVYDNKNNTPVFFRTTDGGANWSGPIKVNLELIDAIVNNLPAATPPTALDYDLVVDKNGEPHLGMVCSAGDDEYHGFYLVNFVDLYDLTYSISSDTWSVTHIDTIDQYFGYFNFATSTSTTPSMTQNNRVQATISPDGSRVAFVWADRNAGISVDDYFPDLYGAAMNVDTKKWTPISSFTAGNVDLSGYATQHLAAPVSLYYPSESMLMIPVTISDVMQSGNYNGQTSTLFYYLQNIRFYDTHMTLDQPFNSPFNSVSSVNNAADVVLSPNPASDLVSVRGLGASRTEIRIVNVLGATVQTIETNQDVFNLPVGALESGVYMMVLTTNGNTATKRFVVQR